MMRPEYIKSDTFTVDGYDWVICFYPYGNNNKDSCKDSDYCSVYVTLVSYVVDVKALFELTLYDLGGKDINLVRRTNWPYTLKNQGHMWGCNQFIKRQTLIDSDYYKNDSLLFGCTVGVISSCVLIVPPPSELAKNITFLLDTGTGSDIVVRVKDDTFKAHKLILFARSPVFHDQFYGVDGNSALNELELKDIESSFFKAVLSFIYSNKFPDFQDFSGSMSIATSMQMTQNLLVAADRFGLERLKQFCEAKFCEELNVETVATTLSCAHEQNFSQLKALCLHFAVANLRTVMRTEGFKCVKETYPSLLLELLETIASGGIRDHVDGLSRSAAALLD